MTRMPASRVRCLAPSSAALAEEPPLKQLRVRTLLPGGARQSSWVRTLARHEAIWKQSGVEEACACSAAEVEEAARERVVAGNSESGDSDTSSGEAPKRKRALEVLARRRGRLVQPD